MEAQILSNEQYRDLSRKIMHAVEKQCRVVPMNSLRHPMYRLKTPVFISLEFLENEIIASLDDIEAFAHADTEFEAIDLLCEEIIQVYEDLLEDRENLGILPQKWLQYLEGLIGCRYKKQKCGRFSKSSILRSGRQLIGMDGSRLRELRS